MISAYSLYIHIPFCRHKCPYCDFNTYALKVFPEDQYVNALLAEFEHYRADIFSNRKIETVYFGGGTPSLLSVEAIKKILQRISSDFVSADIEVTLEANPGEVSVDKLKAFFDCGINRLSFGSQSFKENVLKTLGRKHSAADIFTAVSDARMAGFKNLNLDLIFAVPGQSIEDLQFDLKQIKELSPEHVSCYELTIEKGTPFYQSVAKGILKKSNDSEAAIFYELICGSLKQQEIQQYEISNFARAGFESRHNSNYWRRKAYLGLGAGAHSYLDVDYGKRFANLASIESYLSAISKKSEAVSWQESLTRSNAVTEFFMLGLRQIKGVSLDEFRQLYGESLLSKYQSKLEILKDKGQLEIKDRVAKLTDSGLLLADQIFSELALCD